MKKIALSVLLLVSTFLWAAPGPDEQTINVHVVSSYLVILPAHEGNYRAQKLNVVIDGKKYELTAVATRPGLLALGDYKATLVRDEHKTTYEVNQEYDFLFPDKTTRKFFVSGLSE